jgi:large subunit ribosomal protein L22
MSRARSADKPKLGDMVSVARMRYYGVGPRKVRFVADAIRGLTVGEAQARLAAIHRPSGVPILSRLLKSAVSNANQSLEGAHFEENDLIVGRVLVDGGPMIKRFRPMSMGRAGKIRKRTCHIRVELYESLGEE